MRYLSLFSGIEAASAAWEPLGWECAAFSEIEASPCKLLAARYPHVPNLGDLTKITREQVAALGRLDLVVFGSPCQDLSIAGNREGLVGERSGLFYAAMRIVEWCRELCGTRFVLWENVPGAFTSNGGADFGIVVAALCGMEPIKPPHKRHWGNEGAAIGRFGMVEWATLDAQWFGVAQRRRRVFALADFGDWPGRQPILIEPQSMRGDSAPSREAGETIAETLADVSHALCGNGFDASEDGTGRGTPIVAYGSGNDTAVDIAHTLNAGGGMRLDFESETFIAFNVNAQPDEMTFDPFTSGALTCSQSSGALTRYGVRRFTPRECERLQAFVDGYTAVAGLSDSARYRALGNSMCVNVMRWIGASIERALAVQAFFAGYPA